MTVKYKYQLVIIGAANKVKQRITQTFHTRIKDLGLASDTVEVLASADFHIWNPDAPTVAVYFGEKLTGFPDEQIIDALIAKAAYILPIVSDLEKFPDEIPKQLLAINGMGLNKSSVDSIVSVILEAFGLLRLSRRLFISYKRSESTALAIQLYEELDSIGFDVFLDTHSVRPALDFQTELWHRLADTDVVLLIDTPDFRNSKWTTEELGQASAMSIGIFQLIWPGHHPSPDSGFCFTRGLQIKDFKKAGNPNEDSRIKNKVVKEIKSAVESLRARNLSARQNLLIGNFIETAKAAGRSYTLQPQRFIIYETKIGEDIVVIPTVGVPDAYGFHFSDNLIKRIHEKKIKQVNILYDRTNIKESWQEHLLWLNNFLPVKSVSITDLDEWITNN